MFGSLIEKLFKSKSKNEVDFEKTEVLPKEEINKLDGEEFYDAVIDYVGEFCDDDIETLNEEQLCAVTAYWFDSEVQNGGLEQFFFNSSRAFAPYVAASLEKIGAKKVKKHFDDFVQTNNIDLNDVEPFLDKVEELEDQDVDNPCDAFDDEYYELYEKEDVLELMVAFVKENFDRVIVDEK